MEPETNLVELDKLIRLFYPIVTDLGEFQTVSADQIPEPQRSLLSHNFHMTVTLEKFHSSPVRVAVLQETEQNDAYSREICLHRTSDDSLVQYGIVRLNFKHLSEAVQQEIRNHSKPLGRILIEYDVHRRVQLLSLYEIKPANKLAEMQTRLAANGSDSAVSVDNDPELKLYGRTAVIYCNDEPAIELLEIVTL